MPFRFRLEKVLKVRRRVLEQRTREVAEAGRAHQRCLDREAALAAEYGRLSASAPAAAGAVLDVRDLAELALRLRRLGDERREAAQVTRLAELELERRRQLLTAAWRDVEVLRKLEERRRDQWEEEQRRDEARLLDEVGGLRADRLRRSKVSA